MTSEQLAWKIRRHGVEMTHLSGGSHLGAILSVADIMAVLYTDVLRVDPKNTEDENRDRFILSKGHAGASVYAALAEFKSNPEHKILIASQNILATSVTLIECTFAIYLETSFSFETYLQSTGRIYRIGQDKHVRFYHIWLNGSTDMFHVNAIETKRSLVDTLFSAKEKPVLSLAQMRDLFSGKAV